MIFATIKRATTPIKNFCNNKEYIELFRLSGVEIKKSILVRYINLAIKQRKVKILGNIHLILSFLYFRYRII